MAESEVHTAASPVYDNYEISPCRRCEEPGKPGQYYFEVCEPHESDVWTLYGHIERQGVEPIGDFSSRKAAEEVYYRITGEAYGSHEQVADRLRLMHAAPLLLEALEPYAIHAKNRMEWANGEDNEDTVDHIFGKLVDAYAEASPRPPGASVVTRQIERLLQAGYLYDWDDASKTYPEFIAANLGFIPQSMWSWSGLDRSQQERMLHEYVDWDGFDHPSSDHVKRNVLAGRPKEEWFAGLDSRWRGRADAATDPPRLPEGTLRDLSRAEMEAFAAAAMKEGFNWAPEPGRLTRPGPEETPLERVERQIGHIKVLPDSYDFRIEELGPWNTEVSEEWKRLPESEKLSRLVRQVDWREISVEDRHRLLEREVDFNRVPADDPMPTAGEMKLLAEEIRQDEHAARVRDYGEADAATYEQRVREGAETTRHLEPSAPNHDDWMAKLSIDDHSRTELAAELDRVKRDTYVELEEQVAGWNYTHGEGGYRFHKLPVTDREVMVKDFVDWNKYMERGLTFEGQALIMHEAARDPIPRQSLANQEFANLMRDTSSPLSFEPKQYNPVARPGSDEERGGPVRYTKGQGTEMAAQVYEDMKMDIKFQGKEYGVRKTHYHEGGRTAIVLWDKEHNEIGYVATVNLPDERLGKNQTFDKDYSENQGMLQTLENAGIVKDTGMHTRSGFVDIPIAELQGRFREDAPEKQYNPQSRPGSEKEPGGPTR
jgi:hypothetical protein